MDLQSACLYCKSKIINDDCLCCINCNQHVHIKCLKRKTPGDLIGDVFFQFKCLFCSPNNKEEFVRNKLPWLLVIVLTLYNLSIQSNGLGHNGYFHWRTHIAFFIEKYWNHLFPLKTKQRKKWIGTVSGTLSHNNPEFFVSGIDIIKEPGWWKLTYNQPPKFYLSLFESMAQKRHQKFDKLEYKNNEDINVVDVYNSDDDVETKRPKLEEEIFSRTLPYMGRSPHKKIVNKISEPTENDSESLQSNLTDFLANELSNSGFLDDITQLNSCVNLNSDNNLFLDDSEQIWPTNLLLPENNFDLMNYSCVQTADTQQINVNSNSESNILNRSLSPSCSGSATGDEIFYPRIIKVTNFQQEEEDDEDNETITNIIDYNNIKIEPKSSSSEDDQEEVVLCEKSLFTVTEKRMLPWEAENCLNNNNAYKNYDENIKFMSEYEENMLNKKLKVIINNEPIGTNEIPSWVRRLYRKLYVRKLKKTLSKTTFDLDNINCKISKKNTASNVLDRYQLITNDCHGSVKEDTSFHARLASSTQYDLFVSPYTGRILHPFIYRNTKCIPNWIKLMCEIQYHVNEEMPARASIDYCYVRPQHIAAVNSLLQNTFWPGIDMSECLSYPDFSIVALYKKLVVGCAFLVPDVGYSEAYVSFMAVRPDWQRSGIASFMLYHLTQTCMSKDITLHVSATNPAICLYQKFGFKIEELILDFYDKYFPIDSTHSRHAFFLRMRR